MIKGFAITPVVVGRIGIGEIVESNGKKLPKKLDHIVLTKNFEQNGGWAAHPLMQELIEAQKQKTPSDIQAEKLRSIPVRIMFNRPTNNFRAEYTCFTDKGSPLCSGNGESAKRVGENGIEDVVCAGADKCQFGQKSRCKPFARLIIAMESHFENDPLVGMMFRTTSFNSIRALSYRLQAFAALTGGKMAGMPCNLVMKAKSTSASFRKPIYYLDLEPVDGLMAATKIAQEYDAQFQSSGLNREELEKMVEAGLAQSAFFESGDDGEEILEEFAVDEHDHDVTGASASSAETEMLCSKEQADDIARLLNATGKELSDLLNLLVKPSETKLNELTAAEAQMAIDALSQPATAKPSTPVVKASSVDASASGEPTPESATKFF